MSDEVRRAATIVLLLVRGVWAEFEYLAHWLRNIRHFTQHIYCVDGATARGFPLLLFKQCQCGKVIFDLLESAKSEGKEPG